MRRSSEDRLECIADTKTGGRTLTSPTQRRDNSDSGRNAKAILLPGLCFCRFASRQTKSRTGDLAGKSPNMQVAVPVRNMVLGEMRFFGTLLEPLSGMGTKWAERWE